MNYSKDGLKLTEQFEGCRLEAYPDPATGEHLGQLVTVTQAQMYSPLF